MIQADWYFDFVSPFAYLQLAEIDRLNLDCEIRFRPILLTASFNWCEGRVQRGIRFLRKGLDLPGRLLAWNWKHRQPVAGDHCGRRKRYCT